jgi:N-acetylneuraminate synthase
MNAAGSKVIVIAEAGVNHNGDIGMAKNMVRAAAAAGADYVKFQTFRSEASIRAGTPKAEYQTAATGDGDDMLEMVKKLELPFDAFRDLAGTAAAEGIGFLSTAFDSESITFLKTLDLDYFKIPSGETTNARLLLDVAEAEKPILMSTGTSNLDEIEAALGVIAFGLSGEPRENACGKAFADAFAAPDGQARLRKRVTLLHCTTQYPAPFGDINLRAMATMRDRFELAVGYSDHSLGLSVPIAAAALGARVIEKHFTLDRNLTGPDHAASLEPGELTAMVRAVREVELALGSSTKAPAPSELANRELVRKSLVALRPIRAGEIFSAENVGAKRPGTGISAMRMFDVIGTKAERDFQPDDFIGTNGD